jgi:hypothetical protein
VRHEPRRLQDQFRNLSGKRLLHCIIEIVPEEVNPGAKQLAVVTPAGSSKFAMKTPLARASMRNAIAHLWLERLPGFNRRIGL